MEKTCRVESEFLKTMVESSDDEDFWLLEESSDFSASISETFAAVENTPFHEPPLLLLDDSPQSLSKHRLNPRLTSMIDIILKQKASCSILDLGSGSPSITGCIYAALQLPTDCEPPGMYSYGGGSFGSFRLMAHAKDSGINVSLKSVDVIFPPLSKPIQGESPAYFAGYPYSVISKWFESTNVTCVGDNIESFVKQSVKLSEKFDIVASRTVYSGGLKLDDAHSLLNDRGIFIMDFSKLELQQSGRLMIKDQEILKMHCKIGGFHDATVVLSESPTHSRGERLFYSSVVMFHQNCLRMGSAHDHPQIHVERALCYEVPENDKLDVAHLFPGVKTFEKALKVASHTELATGAKKLLGLYFSSAKSRVSKLILPALSVAYTAIKDVQCEFEVVFVSMDETEQQMMDHSMQMPWMSPNWIDSCSVREQLCIICDIKPYWDIPRLVLIDMLAGKILSNDAASAMIDFKNNHFLNADAATFVSTSSSLKQQRIDVLKTFDDFVNKTLSDSSETISLERLQISGNLSVYETLSSAALQGKCSVALLFGNAPNTREILSRNVFLGCLQVVFYPWKSSDIASDPTMAQAKMPGNWQKQVNDEFVMAMYLAVRADIHVSLLVLLGNDSVMSLRPMDILAGYTVFYAGPVN